MDDCEVVIVKVGIAAGIYTCGMVVRNYHEDYTSDESSPEERHLEV